ncbi:MAG TPA: acyl-ACP thioesterase domain-containing protein [Clostridia bacterium]|nr:acyl-ACP thioesterase domain-containing protein [Clostridia bacterium]
MTAFDSRMGAVYPVQLDSSLFNERGALTISAYQKILSAVAERDLAYTGIDVPSIIANLGVSWVLLSLSLDIHAAVRRDGELAARTWHTSKAGFIYRREIALEDGRGERAVNAAMFFSLLDIKTRRLCMDPAIHARFCLPQGEELLGAASRVSTRGLDFAPVEGRSVRPSWIDYLGHVNNARYGELAYDALTDGERASFEKLSRLELYFTRELLPGDAVTMERVRDGEAIVVRATIPPEGTQSFVVKMEFDAIEKS